MRDIENYAGTAALDHIEYDAYGNVTNETQPSNGDGYKYAGYFNDSITDFDKAGAAGIILKREIGLQKIRSNSGPVIAIYVAMF